MPSKSNVFALPPDIRQELTRKIISNGYGGYVALSGWLAELGHPISKTAIHRFGQELKARGGDPFHAEIEAVRSDDAVRLDVRMRCLELAGSIGEPDVLKAAQRFWEWASES